MPRRLTYMRHFRHIYWIPALLLFWMLQALPSVAQLAPSPDAPPQGVAVPATPQIQQQPIETLKVNVNLVSLYFTVHDKHGALIPGLTKNDFTIYEDKVPQTIKNFEAETDRPLTLGILLDTSGSQQNVLPLEKQAGDQFLRSILRPKDEAFLLSFDIKIELLSDFTNNANQLEQAMNKAEINVGSGGGGSPGMGQGTFPTVGTPKGTLLYDAVYEAANDKLAQQTGRKALILLTDGVDQGSQEKLSDAIEAAQRANAIVYVILLEDRHFYMGGGYGIYNMGFDGKSEMKKLTEATGGHVIDVGDNGKKLAAAFAEIERELRNEYVASYTPTDSRLDGSYRTIEVVCHKKGLKVSVRKGYYAVPHPQGY